jgi:zinc D-Ala-D-Ala carboxypeptidase
MHRTAPARARARRAPKLVLAGLVAVIASTTGTLAYEPSEDNGPHNPTPGPLQPDPSHTILVPETPIPLATSPAISAGEVLPGDPLGALDETDGLVPDGTSVFDNKTPAVANLDPSLLAALRRAATDAAKSGVTFQVSSGWRSPEYQEQLLRDAVARYGSEEEAARWVATPTTSAHVSGHAVDLAPASATTWLSKRGARYGICQIYRNETWHYELRPEAASRGCPPMYADPTQDPRMRR